MRSARRARSSWRARSPGRVPRHRGRGGARTPGRPFPVLERRVGRSSGGGDRRAPVVPNERARGLAADSGSAAGRSARPPPRLRRGARAAPGAGSTERLFAAARARVGHALAGLAGRSTPSSAGTTSSSPTMRSRSCASSARGRPRERVLADWGFERTAVARPRRHRAVHRPVRAPARRWRPRSSRSELGLDLYRDRPRRRRQQVHRRDGEEPRPDLRRGRATRTRSCSSTRRTRCSASAREVRDAHDRYANIEIALPAPADRGVRRRRDPRHEPARTTSTRRSSAGSRSSSASRSRRSMSASASGRRRGPRRRHWPRAWTDAGSRRSSRLPALRSRTPRSQRPSSRPPTARPSR